MEKEIKQCTTCKELKQSNPTPEGDEVCPNCGDREMLDGENPTKQHSMKCPKLCGGECQCDGYHTFDELYDHRITLFIALCKEANNQPYCDKKHNIWRSKLHSDGEICFGTGTQFVLGIGSEKGKQITYHIPVGRWEETDFAETLEKAPEWDGHTPQDVLDRLKNL